MKNYVRDGVNIPVKLTKAVGSGEPLLIGNLFGCCIAGGAPGDEITLRTRGVFEIKKDPAVALKIGDAAYFDASTGVITNKSTIRIPLNEPETLEDGSKLNVRELELPEVGTIIKSDEVSARTCEVRIV